MIMLWSILFFVMEFRFRVKIVLFFFVSFGIGIFFGVVGCLYYDIMLLYYVIFSSYFGDGCLIWNVEMRK